MNKTPETKDTHNANEAGITIMRTPEFFESAQVLSDFVRGLPLDQSANDRLAALMVEHVRQAERGAFASGFCKGVEFGRYEHSRTAQEHASVVS